MNKRLGSPFQKQLFRISARLRMSGNRMLVWCAFVIFVCAVAIAALTASPHRQGGVLGFRAAIAELNKR